MTYGLDDAIQDVLTDLWDHQPLLDALESESPQEHITPGWPAKEQDHPVVLRVQPITETSSHHHTQVRRQYRFQFSLVSTLDWRQWHESNGRYPQYEMAQIMGHVADRMGKDLHIPDALPGTVASGTWEDIEGDRLGYLVDWQIESVT